MKNKFISGMVSAFLQDAPEIVTENFDNFMNSKLSVFCESLNIQTDFFGESKENMEQCEDCFKHFPSDQMKDFYVGGSGFPQYSSYKSLCPNCHKEHGETYYDDDLGECVQLSENILVDPWFPEFKHKAMRKLVVNHGWIPAGSINGGGGLNPKTPKDAYIHPDNEGETLHLNKPDKKNDDKNVYWNHQKNGKLVHAGSGFMSLRKHLRSANDEYTHEDHWNDDEEDHSAPVHPLYLEPLEPEYKPLAKRSPRKPKTKLTENSSKVFCDLLEIRETLTPKIVQFGNKTSRMVSEETANIIVELYKNLGDTEKSKLISSINESVGKFNSILQFSEGFYGTEKQKVCDYCDTPLDEKNKAEYGHGIYKQTGKTSRMASLCKDCKDACHKSHMKMIPESFELNEVQLLHSTQNSRIHNLLKDYGYNMDPQKSRLSGGKHKIFVHEVTGNSIEVGPLDTYDSLKSRLSSQEKVTQ